MTKDAEPTAAGAPPGWGAGPGTPPPPPYAGAGFSLRHGLVRPKQGRYVAGVCAAIGRATNTDPVLWRVLLAVLGFFGGVGLLVYVAVWLVTPADGDTASPVEAMLGRGRSSTSPILVIILGLLAALTFGFIVTDGFRAALLGAAVLIGGALLLNRNAGAGSGPTQPAPAGAWSPAWGAPAGPPTAGPAPAAPADRPQDATLADEPAGPRPATGDDATVPAPPAAPEPIWPAPSPSAFGPGGGGYRPPFAPHGPYGGGPPPPVPATAPPPPRPPRERSGLGAGTFSLIFVALGIVAALDLSGTLRVGPSAYFAASLITVALGLLVGAWFGRARWLIALGLVLSVALGVATAAESFDGRGGRIGNDVTWRPTTVEGLAERYENNFGGAVLDLRQVDFTGRTERVAVEVNFGELDIILPPSVDVTATVEVDAGDANVFDTRWSGFDKGAQNVTNLGTDGPGGGNLTLDVHVSAGDVEVYR